jgi:glycosyltransferase involved in cell wall biosynthesis
VDYHGKQNLGQKISSAMRILWNREANQKLDALIKEFQPDIAHLHNIYHQLSPSIIHVLKRHGVPVVMTLHDYKIVSPSYTLFAHEKIWKHTSAARAFLDRVVNDSYMKSSICALEKWLHRLLGSYKEIDTLIAPSHFLKALCLELGLKQEITVIPNPLLDIPEGVTNQIPQTLVYVGRLSKEKGVEVIIEAMHLYAKNYTLTIIGDGPEREVLETKVRALGIETRVTFTGALYGKELDVAVMTKEALIVPSIWYENLPYVVTENQARGMVVVASESGGIVERITHGHNGFLFPMGDSKALALVLNELTLKDLQAIRAEAITSTNDLSSEVFLQKIEALYQEVIDRTH